MFETFVAIPTVLKKRIGKRMAMKCVTKLFRLADFISLICAFMVSEGSMDSGNDGS